MFTYGEPAPVTHSNPAMTDTVRTHTIALPCSQAFTVIIALVPHLVQCVWFKSHIICCHDYTQHYTASTHTLYCTHNHGLGTNHTVIIVHKESTIMIQVLLIVIEASINLQTMFDLASLTKVLATTTASMVLYQRGHLLLGESYVHSSLTLCVNQAVL